jgi:hypothetical protein
MDGASARICGGSRSRAFAVTDDPLAEEACCSYVPKGFLKPSVSIARMPVLNVLY